MQAAPQDAGQRLDVFLTRSLSDFRGLSRTGIQSWIAEGRVLVQGVPATRSSARVAAGDSIEVLLPPPPPRRPEPEAPEIRLSILFEDDHLLALDKPPGVVVHPSIGHRTGTLFDVLLRYAESWGDARRPGLVSRLDKDTSGVLLVAKTGEMHAALARALRAPGAEKEYLAVVYGETPFEKGRIDLRLQRDPADPKRMAASKTEGQVSATLYERLDGSSTGGVPLTLLRCRLLTGRMHQIRAHLSAQGLPIVGDPVYGAPRWKGIQDPELAALCRDFPRQALHARRLSFEHPVTRVPLEVAAPVPPDLADLLSAACLGYS